MSYSGNSATSSRSYPDGRDRDYARAGSGSGGYHHKKTSSSSYHRESPPGSSSYDGQYSSSGHSSYAGRSTTTGDESRAQSLSQQLASAQSQVMRLESELSTVRTAKTQAERSLLGYRQLQQRNGEVVEVMKTLEVGVEALQREKTTLTAEKEELKAKLEASERNCAVLNEQVTYLNERNSTLSKKCVDLLDSSKDCREKVVLYEDELKRIKPRYEEMEAKFGGLVEANRDASTRLSMFEMRERIWIREKAEMDERNRMTMENMQKVIAELRHKHEMDLARLRVGHPPLPGHFPLPMQQPNGPMMMMAQQPNGPSKAEMEQMGEKIKALQQLLVAIQQHHKSELERHQKRIAHLEKIVEKAKQVSLVRKPNGEAGGGGGEADFEMGSRTGDKELDAMLDDDDEVIILLDGSSTSAKQETKVTEELVKTAPAGGGGEEKKQPVPVTTTQSEAGSTPTKDS